MLSNLVCSLHSFVIILTHIQGIRGLDGRYSIK